MSIVSLNKLTLIILLTPILVLLTVPEPEGKAKPETGRDDQSRLVLKIDEIKGARVLYAGMPVLSSITGEVTLFKRSPASKRNVVLKGPWRKGTFQGDLRETAEGYVLTATDRATGGSCIIRYVQAPGALQVHFEFRIPEGANTVQYDIADMLGELFEGASLSVTPARPRHLTNLPTEALDYGKGRHVFVRNAREIRIQNDLWSLELAGLTDQSRMNLADFRKVPWSKQKGFKAYYLASGLRTGDTLKAAYEIRIRAVSQADETLRSHSPAAEQGPYNNEPWKIWSYFKMPPKAEKRHRGTFQLTADTRIIDAGSGGAARILAEEIRELTGWNLRVEQSVSSSLPMNGIVIGVDPAKADTGTPPHAEGYSASAEEKQIRIWGADKRGCLFGAYALMARLEKNGVRWTLPKGAWTDWPDLQIRGICTVATRALKRDVGLFKRYIKAFSRAGANTVVFYHTPEQVQDWQTGKDSHWWLQRQMQEVADYARSLHMDVWAGFRHKFSKKRFPRLPLSEHANIYDPTKAQSYDVLFSLYEVLLETYHPSTLLIGHDEIKGLARYTGKAGKDPSQLFATSVKNIMRWGSEHGLETAIFGDMLLNHAKWGASGAAHGGDPNFNSGNIPEAIHLLPKQLKILDWHYANKPSYPTVDYFRKMGFRVYGCTWHDPLASETMASSVKTYGGDGIIGTDWRFWATLAPANTTLQAVKAAWADPESECGESDMLALSETLRQDLSLSSLTSIPVPLNGFFNETTWDTEHGDSMGVFNLGPSLDLRILPKGEHRLGAVLFRLADPEKGAGNNCIVVGGSMGGAGRGADSATLRFQNLRTDALAFLHSCYLEEPQHIPREIGEYRFLYANGDTLAVPIKEAWNITDVRSIVGLRKFSPGFHRGPDILAGARLAWRGRTTSGLPLNAQVFIWHNPFPDQRIAEITMSLNKQFTNTPNRICLLTISRFE